MDHDFDACRNPIWNRFERRWRMAWAFWQGGLAVLQPGYPATDIIMVSERQASGSGEKAPEGAPRASRYEWGTLPWDGFLFKHSRESMHEYQDRCRRTINLPLYQYVINTLSAGTLRDWPVRTGLDEAWIEYHADMDLVGTDVDAFMRRALSLGLVFGRMHAVTDMAAPDSPALSRADQIARGERPYSYLVTPLDLVDWAVDARGRFTWAVILEDAPDTREPGIPRDVLSESSKDSPAQYRVWRAQTWEVWRRMGRARKFELVDRGEHGLERPPIATLYCTRLAQAADMACETPLPDLLDLNRHLLNELSELDETDRAQAFAILGIPEVDGMSMGSIDIGPKRGLAYPAEGGAPSYISSDPGLPTGRWARLSEKSFLGRQLGCVSRGKAEYSKEERSAAAISVEGEEKKNQLAWWSKALQEFDQCLHRDAAAWMGRDEYPTVAYSTNFDTKGITVEIQELVQFAGIKVVGEARKAVAAMAAPLARKMMREQGIDESEINAALADLKAAGEKEPPAPVLPFGASREEGDDEEDADAGPA